MLFILTTVHVIVCIFLILVVLLQQGKGADLSVFGGGSTQAVFGARGAATLLHKLTVSGFIAFIVTTIGIGFLKTGSSGASVMTDVVEEEALPEAGEPILEPEAAPGEAPATDEGAVDPDAAAPGGEGGEGAAGDAGAASGEPEPGPGA